MSAIVRQFEDSLALPFLGIGMKTDLFHVPIAILLIVSSWFLWFFSWSLPWWFDDLFFQCYFWISFCFLCICCRFVVTIGSYILTCNNDICVHIYIYTHSQACVLSHFSRVGLCATLWTIAHQAALSIGYCTQKHWSGLPCPLPGDLPDPGIKPASPSWYLRLQIQFQKFSAHLATL